MFSEKKKVERKNILLYQDLLKFDREDLERLRSRKQEAHSPKSCESEQEELTELARKLSVLLWFWWHFASVVWPLEEHLAPNHWLALFPRSFDRQKMRKNSFITDVTDGDGKRNEKISEHDNRVIGCNSCGVRVTNRQSHQAVRCKVPSSCQTKTLWETSRRWSEHYFHYFAFYTMWIPYPGAAGAAEALQWIKTRKILWELSNRAIMVEGTQEMSQMVARWPLPVFLRVQQL